MSFFDTLKSGFGGAQQAAKSTLQGAQQVVSHAQQGTSQALQTAQKLASDAFIETQRVAKDMQQVTSEGIGKAAQGTLGTVTNAWNKRVDERIALSGVTCHKLRGFCMLGNPAAFQHVPVAHEPGIRLIRILPAEFSSDVKTSLAIRCEMHQFSIADCPAYVALSYCWGDSTWTYPIIIDNGVWQVRPNLFYFLMYARKTAEVSEFYWIDALCIDQENLGERNHFVARMKDIYESARTVVIWLGAGVEGAEESFETIDNYADIADLSLEGLRRWGPKPKDAAMLEVLLYRHPYWGRGWILQEASTPHESAVSMSLTEVWYGRQRRFLDEYISVLSVIHQHGHQGDLSFGMPPKFPLERIAAIRNRRYKPTRNQYPPMDLMSLLLIARATEVTDPRDKIYALLAIAADGKEIQVDYSDSVSKIYRDLTMHFLRRDNNLDIIGFSSGTSAHDLPSWAPDWTELGINEPLPKRKWERMDAQWHASSIYNSSAGVGNDTVISTDGNLLTISGIVFDVLHRRISRFGDYINSDTGFSDPYISGGSRLAAFAHALVADINATDDLNITRGASIPSPILDKLVNRKTSEAARKDLMDHYLLWRIHYKRTLVETKKGYLGLGTDLVEVGDLVCIVGGAQVPLILREEAGGTFRFMGECYVHGIMDGEAVRDPGEFQTNKRTFTVV